MLDKDILFLYRGDHVHRNYVSPQKSHLTRLYSCKSSKTLVLLFCIGQVQRWSEKSIFILPYMHSKSTN